MNTPTLKKRIIREFLAVILVFAVCGTLLGYYVIHNIIIKNAQEQVRNNLKVAHTLFFGEITQIKKAFEIIADPDLLIQFKQKIGLDYAFYVPFADISLQKSEFVRQAAAGKSGAGGTRIFSSEEVQKLGKESAERISIPIQFTPKAVPTDKKVMTTALVLEYAQPVFEGAATLKGVVYGGKIINRDFALIDKIHDLLFENRSYNGKPLGTVTLFLDDVRVATNVLNKEGKSAVGTRVSQRVYEKVLDQGRTWVDRAFVVTEWYLTAYEPIKDVNGKNVGMLYVGMLEEPFRDMSRNIFAIFLLIIFGASGVAVVLAYILASTLSQPLHEMVSATTIISGGDLSHRIPVKTSIKELNKLAGSFNTMAEKLAEREKSLTISNEKLAALNKSYLDLVSFVAHELKGILSSAILNAYGVRDGILGLINFKQRKALDAVCRNLDYFSSTVKNFLNLSRIEKGELAVNKIWLLVNEDVFNHAVESFAKPAEEKSMRIVNNLRKDLLIKADPDLMEMVANNLVGNAIKYGLPQGTITLKSAESEELVTIEVYNDGVPLTAAQQERLFQKFSRLDTALNKKVRGTGLGLYITRQIIEKHGGKIWIEAHQQGNAFVFQIEKGGVYNGQPVGSYQEEARRGN